MKRILVISWFYPPINSSEGLVTYKLLNNSTFQYDVFTQKKNKSWSYGNKDFLPQGAHIHCIYAKSEYLLDWKEEAIAYFKRHADEYDIVMTRSMPPESHDVGAAIKKIKPSVKWIASFGDPIADNPFVKMTLADHSPYSIKNRYERPMALREIFSVKRELRNIRWHLTDKRASDKVVVRERKSQQEYLSGCDMAIFNSQNQMDYMMEQYPKTWKKKGVVLPHSYDPALYPRNSASYGDGKIHMVYIGHLDAIRTPRPFLRAIHALSRQDEHLAEKLCVEFYGNMFSEDKVYIMDHELYDIVRVRRPVSYLQSLEVMKRADWLLHIDANIHKIIDTNIFFAAKLADYIGAGKNIFGITMLDGASAEILRSLNALVVSHSMDEIRNYLSLILYDGYTLHQREEVRDRYRADQVAEVFERQVKERFSIREAE